MRRARVLFAIPLVVLAAAMTLAVASRGGNTPVAAHAKAAPSGCAKALLRDWTDGRIDRTYPVGCYRAALQSLPFDLRVYSSAPDDISQALSQRIVQGRHRSTRSIR